MEKDIKQLRARAKHLSPIMQIGKNGLGQGSLELLDRELEQKHLIKIKLLKGALPEDATKADRQGLAQRMASETKSQIVEQVGNIVVLYRP